MFSGRCAIPRSVRCSATWSQPMTVSRRPAPPPISRANRCRSRARTTACSKPATGQIEAVQSIDLRPEVDGRIVEIPVHEGQEVDEGTPLFKVDDAQLKAQVAQLEAQRDLAQQALARAKELAQQNASSAADLEKAEAEARGAQAQYDLQRIRLDRTTVRAPFAGAVGQRYVSLGDYVTSSTKPVSLHTVK